MKNILKLEIKDFIFNSTMVKADMFFVKEKKSVLRNKDDIQNFIF